MRGRGGGVLWTVVKVPLERADLGYNDFPTVARGRRRRREEEEMAGLR